MESPLLSLHRDQIQKPVSQDKVVSVLLKDDLHLFKLYLYKSEIGVVKKLKKNKKCKRLW